MDAFHASYKQGDNPELRGDPLASSRTVASGMVVVSCCDTREFGSRPAVASVTAARKSPELIFVKPRFEVYRAVLQQIRDILPNIRR
jgi:DNA polymerase-4